MFHQQCKVPRIADLGNPKSESESQYQGVKLFEQKKISLYVNVDNDILLHPLVCNLLNLYICF